MIIFVDENIPNGKGLFSSYGDVILFSGRSLTSQELSNANALIVRSVTKVNASLLDNTPVEFVGTATIGTDHIDQNYLKEKNISFAFAPGCNSNSVGEYIVSALLKISQKHTYDLDKKVLGVVGYGNVGKNVAQKAHTLGLKTLICDPPLAEIEKQNKSDVAFCDIEQIQAESDILTFHVPLTKGGPHSTYHMVDSSFIRKLQRNPILLNTSRGDVFNGEAVKLGLLTNRISHLVLDVFPQEPNLDPQLCEACDWITPHVAGYSMEGKSNGGYAILKAFCQHFRFSDPIIPSDSSYSSIHSFPTNTYLEQDDATQILTSCVHQAYDISQDDTQLRNALKEQDVPKAFDKLRKNYPIRREFPYHQISFLSEKQSELKQKLSSLGFSITSS